MSRVAFKPVWVIAVVTVMSVAAAQASTMYSVSGPDVGETEMARLTFPGSHGTPYPTERFEGVQSGTRQIVFNTQITQFRAGPPGSRAWCGNAAYSCNRSLAVPDGLPSPSAGANYVAGNMISVPEPATLALMGLGLLALCLARCRRVS